VSARWRWKPPDKEKAGQRGNPGGLRNPEPGGTGETDNTSMAFRWQRGLSSGLIAAVVMHRECHPRDPLPESLQRQIGHAWREYVLEAR
jgi:hypothetical protein